MWISRRRRLVTGNPFEALIASSAASFSTRRLRSGYSGALLRVRRSSDNAEADIGAASNGDLDQQALTAFVGAPLYPLSALSVSAAAAYSLRKIKADYAGAAVRVRRSSDNAEADIGFATLGAPLSINGGFDTDTFWTKGGGTTISGGVLNATGAASIVSANLGLVSGQRYVVSFDFNCSAGSGLRVNNSTSFATNTKYIRPSLVGASGTVQFSFIASGPGFSIEAYSAAYTGTIDNVVVRPITQGAGGDLDIATLIDFVAPSGTAQASVASGYVTTLYDQSGNGRHATQATAANQFRIVNAGVIDVMNGRPAIYSPNSNCWYAVSGLPTSGVMDVFSVLKMDSSIFQGLVIGNGSSTSYIPLVASGSANANVFRVNSAQDPAGLDAYINGSTVAVTRTRGDMATALSAAGGVIARISAVPMSAGAVDRIYGNGSWGLSGFSSEIVLLPSALSTADRLLLEQSQSVYYGITYANTIPSGYVTTLYDQSGNGRHVTLTTAANQFRIVNAGVVDTLNGRPTLIGNALSVMTATGPTWSAQPGLTLNAVWKRPASGAQIPLLLGTAAGAAGIGIGYNQTSGGFIGFIYAGATSVVAPPASTEVVQTATYTPLTSLSQWINGGSNVSVVPGALTTTAAINFGGWGNNTPLNGVSETVIFASALSTAERQLMERNQGAYFGITVA